MEPAGSNVEVARGGFGARDVPRSGGIRPRGHERRVGGEVGRSAPEDADEPERALEPSDVVVLRRLHERRARGRAPDRLLEEPDVRRTEVAELAEDAIDVRPRPLPARARERTAPGARDRRRRARRPDRLRRTCRARRRPLRRRFRGAAPRPRPSPRATRRRARRARPIASRAERRPRSGRGQEPAAVAGETPRVSPPPANAATTAQRTRAAISVVAVAPAVPGQTRSRIVAMPWPPPMHIVTRAVAPPLRSRASRAVPRSIAPVAPSG